MTKADLLYSSFLDSYGWCCDRPQGTRALQCTLRLDSRFRAFDKCAVPPVSHFLASPFQTTVLHRPLDYSHHWRSYWQIPVRSIKPCLNRTDCNQLLKQVWGVIWLHFISIPFHVWVNISSFLCNFPATEIASVISVWLERFWCVSWDCPAERCQVSRGRLERSGFPFDFHIGAHSPNKLSHAQPWTRKWSAAVSGTLPGLAWNSAQEAQCVSFFLPHHDCKLKCSENKLICTSSVSAGHQNSFYLLHRRYFTCRPVKTVPKSLAF